MAGNGGNFFLVHVATPLEWCEKVDRKGYFAKARAGEIKGVPGIDQVYEAPGDADLTVDLRNDTVPEIVHCKFIHFRLFSGTVLISAVIMLLESQNLV